MTIAEANGPDPCNKNIKCRDFHDSLGRRAGDGVGEVAALGGTYNCCCCDPCRFVRPQPQTSEEDGRLYPCRCVPRGLMLVFEPDDPDAECCKRVGVAIWNQPGPFEEYVTKYEGSLFGVDVTIYLGRVIGDGYAEDQTCGWSLSAVVGYEGYGTDDTLTIEIDHDEDTCLYVPAGIVLAEVEGPDGCMGYLTVEDLDKARLPFLERADVDTWDGPNFIDLTYDPVGPCEQVCSKICLTGERHTDGEITDRVEFNWFDDTAYGGDRGWEYENDEGFTERLLLSEDEYGNAVITPDLEDGPEIYDPITVDSTTLCSCKLNEPFSTTIGPTTYAFRIRCGFCSCWEFACGTCRCVPYELCAMLWDGSTMHTNLAAIWNADSNSWDAGDDGYGGYLLRLKLRRQGDVCVVVPEVNGVEMNMTAYPVHDCGEETVTGQFTGKHDVVSITAQGTVDGTPMAVIAGSLLLDCDIGPCEELPCFEDCGSQPDKLTVNIRQWTELGDTSDPYYSVDCSADIEVHRWQVPVNIVDGSVQYSCGYVGYGLSCGTCVVKVEIQGGGISFSPFPSGCSGVAYSSWSLVNQECGPYSAGTGEQSGAPLDCRCLGCASDCYTVRWEATATESEE